MQKTIRGAALAGALCLSVGAHAGDRTVGYASDHSEMSAAVMAAMAALPLFMTHVVDETGRSEGNAAIKVAIPVGENGVQAEVIWLSPFMVYDDRYGYGILANAPNNIAGKAQGDGIEFDLDKVVDWSFQGPDRKLYGNYTSRVQLKELGSSYDWLRERLSKEPVPADWQPEEDLAGSVATR